MYKCWHHNKCIHVQVNNTWNKASFKLTVLTIMYLQTVNPTSYYHLNTAETVLLLRCASQSHSSQRGCRCATGWGRPWWRLSEPHYLEARAEEHMQDNLTAAVSAPNNRVLLSMSTTTCKTFTQSLQVHALIYYFCSVLNHWTGSKLCLSTALFSSLIRGL